LASKPSRSQWTYLNTLRFGKVVPAGPQPRWRFGANAREQLLRILDDRPDLVTELEHEVSPSGYRSDPEQTRLRDQRGSIRLAHYQRLHRAVRELRKALAVLDWDGGEDVQTGGDGEYAYDNNCADPEIDLVWFDDTAADVEKVTRWLVVARKRRRPGRPKGAYGLSRWALAHGVGMCLDRAGFRLSRSRDGVLAKTLTVVLDSAGFRVPEDMFPLVRRVTASVGEVKARRAARAAAGSKTASEKKV